LPRRTLSDVEQDLELDSGVRHRPSAYRAGGGRVPRGLTEASLAPFQDIRMDMPWRKGQRPKLVREKDAGGNIAPIYQEIRESLGLPYVPAPFLIFAAVPKFLELQWAMLRPLVQTGEFIALAERLRADGYTRAHNYFHVPDLCHRVQDLRFSTGARQELTSTIELLHYADSLVLLMMAAQLQAFDHKVGTGKAEGAGSVADERPRFSERPVFIEEDSAPNSIRKLYDDIKRTTAMPWVTTDYLAMARWPDFLEAYWQAMKPLVQSPIYSQSVSAVCDTAWQVTRELPVSLQLTCDQLTDAGMEDEDVGACVRLTELFVKNLSGMTLNIAAAKIGLEGGSAAAPQLFPQELPTAA